jgi:hypothetical protein
VSNQRCTCRLGGPRPIGVRDILSLSCRLRSSSAPSIPSSPIAGSAGRRKMRPIHFSPRSASHIGGRPGLICSCEVLRFRNSATNLLPQDCVPSEHFSLGHLAQMRNRNCQSRHSARLRLFSLGARYSSYAKTDPPWSRSGAKRSRRCGIEWLDRTPGRNVSGRAGGNRPRYRRGSEILEAGTGAQRGRWRPSRLAAPSAPRMRQPVDRKSVV